VQSLHDLLELLGQKYPRQEQGAQPDHKQVKQSEQGQSQEQQLREYESQRLQTQQNEKQQLPGNPNSLIDK